MGGWENFSLILAKLPKHSAGMKKRKLDFSPLQRVLEMKACFLCRDSKDTSPCPDCNLVHFCTLNDHRIAHKSESGAAACFPFHIESRPEKGNVMVATRDIKAAEVVLEEKPAVSAPGSQFASVCLECHRYCDQKDPELKCSKCHFPLCEQCQVHSKAECAIFGKNRPYFSIDEPCPSDSLSPEIAVQWLPDLTNRLGASQLFVKPGYSLNVKFL